MVPAFVLLFTFIRCEIKLLNFKVLLRNFNALKTEIDIAG